MTDKTNFTAVRVSGFTCTGDHVQQLYWDNKTPGLGVRVTRAGARSYIFEGRIHNRTVRTTIGSVKTWTVARAQQEATRLRSLVDHGIDPRRLRVEQAAMAEKLRNDAEAKHRRDSLRVEDAWRLYLDDHPDWSERHRADHVNLASAGGQKKKRGSGLTVQGVLHPLLKERLVDMSSVVLAEWQKCEGKARPNNARQAFELFRAFWRWCAQHKEYSAIIDKSIVDGEHIHRYVPSRKTKRHDVLEHSQLRSWFSAVRGLPNPIISAYLQTLVLTGARREEIAELRWEHVDFGASSGLASIWIRDKVVEEGRMVPLPPYLAALLSDLHRASRRPPVTRIEGFASSVEWVPSEWVFASPTSASGHVSEPRLAHNRALAIAGLKHVSLHGLRRTFASAAEWVEMPRGVVAQIMGHAPTAIAEKHYILRPLGLLAVWHRRYEAWLLEQAEIRFDGGQDQKLRSIAQVA